MKSLNTAGPYPSRYVRSGLLVCATMNILLLVALWACSQHPAESLAAWGTGLQTLGRERAWLGWLLAGALMGAIASGGVFVWWLRHWVHPLEQLVRRAQVLGDTTAYQPGQSFPAGPLGRLKVGPLSLGPLSLGQLALGPLALGPLQRALDEAHFRLVECEDRQRHRERTLLEHLQNISHDLATPTAALHTLLEELYHLHSEPPPTAQPPSSEPPSSEPLSSEPLSSEPNPAELLQTTGDSTSSEWKVARLQRVDAEALGLVRSALEETAYLSALTEDLAMAERLRAGFDPRSSGQTVDLNQCVDRLALRMRILGRLRQISVEGAHPDEPVRVECHALLVERLIANLVRNALAYGQEDGHVAVMLETLPARRFRLSVMDDGPGVPPEELPRLQERHFRGRSARDTAGKGLGLAIVGEICFRMGWDLRFSLLEPRGLAVSVEGAMVASDLSAEAASREPGAQSEHIAPS